LIPTTTDIFPLFDGGEHEDGAIEDDGMFGNRLDDLALFEGDYTLHARATFGNACSSSRELFWSDYVSVGIDPNTTQVITQTTGFLNDGRTQISISLTPRDRYGNFLGPGRPDAFQLTGDIGTETIGQVVDVGNDSYIQDVAWDPTFGAPPGLVIAQPEREPVLVVDTREICNGTGFGEPGTTVQIPLTLNNGDRLAGFQVEILFDPSVLTPVGVSLGAETAAAGGWTVGKSTVGSSVLRVLGASNPPAGLPAGPAEVAIVELNVVAGVPFGLNQLGVQNCILSDRLGLEIPCQLCPEPGRVVVRPASTFSIRPIEEPVGVDQFDPLPFLVGVDAINSFGALATGYNGTADMVIPSGLCASDLQPNALGFTSGTGADFFKVACCVDPILPATTTNLLIETSDPPFSISGTSAPFLGVAKGDLDANNVVDVRDVIRTTLLSLSRPVAIPPLLGFQQWAGDILDPACAADGTNNILDVVRVTIKALNLPPLCPCKGNFTGGNEAVFAPSGPVGFRIERAGKREFLVSVEDAADLGGFQFDLRSAGPKAEVVLEGLTGDDDWQVAHTFDRGVLRVLAYSFTATGVSGNGAVLRIRNAGEALLADIIASDSRGREMVVKKVKEK
jgi:hypothetical protein